MDGRVPSPYLQEETTLTSLPKAEITGLRGGDEDLRRRALRRDPRQRLRYFRHNPVLKACVLRGPGRKGTAGPEPEDLRALASAGVIGWAWKLDFHRLRQGAQRRVEGARVPRWRESDVFTATGARVLEYAEAMSITPLTVTDEMVANLLGELGDPAMLELLPMGWSPSRTSGRRVQSPPGLESQGYSGRAAASSCPSVDPAAA